MDLSKYKREFIIGVVSGIVATFITTFIFYIISLGMEYTGLTVRGKLAVRLSDPISVVVKPTDNYYIRGFWGDIDYMTYYEILITNENVEDNDDIEMVAATNWEQAHIFEFKAHESFYARDRSGNKRSAWKGVVKNGKEFPVIMKLPPRGNI